MFDALLLIWFLASVGVFVVSFQSGNTFSPWQKLITIIAIGLFGLFAISCLLLTPHFWKLFALTGIYHGLNVARLLKMRTEFRQLRRKVVVSYWKLWLLELLVFVLALNFSSSGFTLADLWAVLNVIMLLAVGFVLLRIILVKSKSKLPRSVGSSTDELPSVSVLIPARNEDHVLETCLNSLLDIDYPKLEIIVLDDCSQDQTSEIIARFAHAGVRFIKGNDPDDDWLGKNHALAQLADEASGELLIFSEVDVRFSANSITQIARAYQQSKFTMISILPQRYGRDFPTSWLYGLTDFWSLVVPTSLQNNTVSSESVFAIKASELNRIGGFEQHQKAINPVN